MKEINLNEVARLAGANKMIVLDADWEQERRRKEEQEQAVVRKWRAWLYSWRAEQRIGSKVQALMISSAVIFLWAVALALLVG